MTLAAPDPWWWLSFCDDSKPAGEQFLGVAIVQAASLVDAVRMAHVRGCNPGGQVMGMPAPPEVGDPPREMPYRVITDKAELDRLERAWNGAHSTGCATVGELEDEGKHDIDAMKRETIVCAHENELEGGD